MEVGSESSGGPRLSSTRDLLPEIGGPRISPANAATILVSFRAGLWENSGGRDAMEQLSGQDASFLYAESPHTPLHVGSIAIYDQSTVPGGLLRFRDILDYNAQRLHLTK